jgi:carotenoid cleavage dioxygenase-like enzyme
MSSWSAEMTSSFDKGARFTRFTLNLASGATKRLVEGAIAAEFPAWNRHHRC